MLEKRLYSTREVEEMIREAFEASREYKYPDVEDGINLTDKQFESLFTKKYNNVEEYLKNLTYKSSRYVNALKIIDDL